MIVKYYICDECSALLGEVFTIEKNIICARFSWGKDQDRVIYSYESKHFCNEVCYDKYVKRNKESFEEFSIIYKKNF